METARRTYFIEKSFQTYFIVKFCIIVIVSSLLMGGLLFFLSRNFTTVAIENARVLVKSTSDFILPFIITTFIAVSVLSAAAVIVLTLFVSHKIAGPVYRLKKEIEILQGGNLSPNFRIRKDDQLQGLATALFEMSSAFKERHGILKARIAQLRDALKNNYQDKNMLEAKVKDLQEAADYFKI
jgi:nitrogen fixation/metabolism regulation signal transduction histidine kinase